MNFSIKGFLLTLLAGTALISAKAQVAQYYFTPGTQPYANTAGANLVIPAGTDDQNTSLINIGFVFSYDGSDYSQFSVSSNGFITLGTIFSGTGANNQLQGAQLPLIAPLWDNLKVSNVTNAGVYYQLQGTAPNRTLVVEWRGMLWDNTASSLLGPTISFQARLYEGSNAIDFRYGQEAGLLSTLAGASIGLSGSPGASQSFLSVSNILSTPAVSYIVETPNINVKPALNQVFSFVPPAILNPQVVQITDCLQRGLTNQPILQINIPGSTNPQNLQLTAFTFSTDNTTQAINLQNAKLFATGTSNTFSTSDPVGTTVSNPNGTFSFLVNRNIVSGNNYFWLAYDVSSLAQVNNVVGARLLTHSVNNISTRDDQPFFALGRSIGTDCVPVTPPSCTDNSKNWTQTTLYDVNGNVIKDVKAYRDLMGRNSQSQQKLLNVKNVLAVQNVFDAFGRPVLSSLSAPTGNTDFCFKSNFMTNAQGNAYSYHDFDEGTKVNQPNQVSESSTLGQYYSSSSPESFNPSAEGYPYSRVEYYNDPECRVKRTSQAGGQLRMGTGHEKKIYYMAADSSLYRLYGQGNTYIPEMSNNAYFSADAYKTVTVDENGLTSVTYFNGRKKLIATCVSGQGSSCSQQPCTKKMLSQTGYDTHIPASKLDSVTLNVSDYDFTNYTFKIHYAAFTLQDLNTGIVLVKGTDYDLVEDANLKKYTVVFMNNYHVTGKDLFLRISFDFIDSYVQLYNNNHLYSQTPDEIRNLTVALNYKLDYSYWTLNYYDHRGRLNRTIPPNAVDCSSGQSSYNSSQAILYTYNDLGWLLSKQSPDEGTTNYVYDSEGKLRFSQDARQQLSGKYSYINYDLKGRVVETGEYNPGSNSPSFANASAIADQPDGLTAAYKTQQDFISYDKPATDLPATLPATYKQMYMLGNVSRTQNSRGTTWYSYDELGRLRWIVVNHSTIGIKTVNYTYDFQGNVTQVAYQKEVLNEAAVHNYTYDADQRMLAVQTSQTGTRSLGDRARYLYYTHGPLKRKELNNTLQGIDYVYTINGWLKGINSADASSANDPGKDGQTGSTFASDVFGMALDYFDGDYTHTGSNINTYQNEAGKTAFANHYNGVVKDMRWQTNEAIANTSYGNQNLLYGYNYDPYYRLTQSNFGILNSSLNLTEKADYKVFNLSYDLNGNIKTLYRNGSSVLLGIPLSMDSLSYTYTANTNRLNYLADQVTHHAYGVDLVNQNANNYTYDASGQQLQDVKGNTAQEYDVYHKVTKVRNATTNALMVTYAYDASGRKIKKATYNTNATDSSETWYVYDVKGNVLSVYNRPQGSVYMRQEEVNVYGVNRLGVLKNTYPIPPNPLIGPPPINNLIGINQVNTLGQVSIPKPIYELSDHLGNVRATISRNTLNQLELISLTDYYPYGSPMPGRQYVTPTTYRYDYQGQEKDPSTAFNEFELRMYDGRVGRWMTPDPMHQFTNPYMAMGNNPVTTMDPKGGMTMMVGAPAGRAEMASMMSMRTLENTDAGWNAEDEEFLTAAMMSQDGGAGGSDASMGGSSADGAGNTSTDGNADGGTGSNATASSGDSNSSANDNADNQNGKNDNQNLGNDGKDNQSVGNGVPDEEKYSAIMGAYNIDKAVTALDDNALSASSGACAKYVRYALEAGGLNSNGHPVAAADYDTYLIGKGFEVINAEGVYTPIKGDISVMESFQGHPYGHIEMYNGNQWISDFRQNDFWPGAAYRKNQPDYTILRW